MTQPADSGQVAQFVDEQIEKLKAHWLSADDPAKTREAARNALIDRIKFAASERQAVIEDCAKIAEDPANREPGWSLSTQRMIARAIQCRGQKRTYSIAANVGK